MTCRMLCANSIGAPIGAGRISRENHYHFLSHVCPTPDITLLIVEGRKEPDNMTRRRKLTRPCEGMRKGGGKEEERRRKGGGKVEAREEGSFT